VQRLRIATMLFHHLRGGIDRLVDERLAVLFDRNALNPTAARRSADYCRRSPTATTSGRRSRRGRRLVHRRASAGRMTSPSSISRRPGQDPVSRLAGCEATMSPVAALGSEATALLASCASMLASGRQQRMQDAIQARPSAVELDGPMAGDRRMCSLPVHGDHFAPHGGAGAGSGCQGRSASPERRRHRSPRTRQARETGSCPAPA